MSGAVHRSRSCEHGFVQVPTGKGPNQISTSRRTDSAGAGSGGPTQRAAVPVDEGERLGSHVNVGVAARVRVADLCVAFLDEQPVVAAASRTGTAGWHFRRLH